MFNLQARLDYVQITYRNSKSGQLHRITCMISSFGIEMLDTCGHITEEWHFRANHGFKKSKMELNALFCTFLLSCTPFNSNCHPNSQRTKTLPYLYKSTGQILSWSLLFSNWSDMLKISIWLPSLRGLGSAFCCRITLNTNNLLFVENLSFAILFLNLQVSFSPRVDG